MTCERILQPWTCVWLAILGALLLLLPAHGESRAQDSYPESVDPYVNDFADLISPSDAREIERLLTDLRSETGIEFTVVTIASVSDYATGARSIESFAAGLFNNWGVGNAERDDGVMLLVARDDREVRIEVGTGYGSSLNGAMQQVIDRNILPAFREGVYSAGILSGAKAIVDRLSRQAVGSNRTATTGGSVSSRIQDAGGVVRAAVAAAAASLLGVFTFGVRELVRRRPHTCPNCGERMVRLDELADNAFLDEGQVAEERLKSVNYDVWHCSACGTHRVRAYRNWFSRRKRCPACSYRTIKETRTITSHATSYSTGTEQIVQNCMNCGYENTEYREIPRERDDDDSDGGFFSGGSSTGGGASGKW